MAVEARHLNIFHLQNRQIMNPIEANSNLYNTAQMGYATVPLPGTTATTVPTTINNNGALPMYHNSGINNSVQQKHAMQSESGVTCNNVPMSRKRSRDSITAPSIATSYLASQLQKNNGTFSFLGEDVSCFFQKQQFEMERLISQHMENVKLELEEKRNRQARKILEVIEMGMMKRLKAKEEEIEKIGKLNWALEERVKSLCIENQIWRDLAQTNEATANALRTNLEQVLAQAEQDDAQSCCGSSGNDNEGNEEAVEGRTRWGAEDGGDERRMRWCRSCGREESCVLLLPCRHLCLCTACGSTVHVCPVCKSAKNASVHVNMC